MREWKHSITMELQATAKESAVALAARLRKLPGDFRSLEEGLTSLDEMIEELDVIAPGADDDDFNSVLSMIYDWADEHGLWLLLSPATATDSTAAPHSG